MKGSFTEELVNRTIDWYLTQEIAYFKKSHIPISITRKYGFNNCLVSLKEKADIDYYGVFNGKYISFEVKETDKDYFVISQIKKHQKEILLDLERYGAVSFLLLNFVSYDDSIFIIKSNVLRNLFKAKKSKISKEEVEAIGRKVPFTYPGIVDWLSVLDLGD